MYVVAKKGDPHSNLSKMLSGSSGEWLHHHGAQRLCGVTQDIPSSLTTSKPNQSVATSFFLPDTK